MLRELVIWRDSVARVVDRATFRVVGNEQLLEATARRQPIARDGLLEVKGMPRGMVESRGEEVLDAIRRGGTVSESDLPRFAKAPRWDKDPSFDVRVSALKTARDAVAERLDLDPGVLCSKDRAEGSWCAQGNPTSRAAFDEVAELRRWQREVLAEDFLRALKSHARTTPSPAATPDSPYRD